MTLSARIAIDPSRRLARLATMLPAGGVVVAALTLALRWPQAAPGLVLLAVAGCALVHCLSIRRRSTRLTLTVSRHRHIDVQPDPAGTDGPWRLVESTLLWPGFSMLALRPADPTSRARTVRVPVFPDALSAGDRRALSRLLIWSLHVGAGDDSRSPRR